MMIEATITRESGRSGWPSATGWDTEDELIEAIESAGGSFALGDLGIRRDPADR